jgi:predicted CXXCH cytochrome family protein
MKSGHPWIISKVAEDQPPDFPFSQVNTPPQGYGWGDISYVIGGSIWKAVFIDKDGFIITSPPDGASSAEYNSQLNLENVQLNQNSLFIPLVSAGSQLPYDCGSCHTTGFSAAGSQDDLPGISGEWVQDGVRCEACHGPGSLHAGNPPGFQMQVERDAQACEKCHVRGGHGDIPVSEGFINHSSGYGDLFPGKHAILDCVTCHDPHSGVNQLRLAGEATTNVECTECHTGKAEEQKVASHTALQFSCVQCHMPKLIKVAWGDPNKYQADFRTHAVSINPSQVSQFSEDGTQVLPQVGLDFACRSCHGGGFASQKSDEELVAAAANYHSPLAEETATP